MNEVKSRRRATAEETTAEGATAEGASRAPLTARITVGLVAGLTGAIVWVVAGLFWDLLRSEPTLRYLTPRGFTGFDNLVVTGGAWPWIGVVGLAIVIVGVVALAVSRSAAPGNRAGYFFAAWFAAVLGAAVAAVIAMVGIFMSTTTSTEQTIQLVVQNVASATYWGLVAGWLVGFAAIGGASLISGPERAEAVGAGPDPDGRRAPAAPKGRRTEQAPMGWSPDSPRP